MAVKLIEGHTMRVPRVRFTVRRLMVIMAVFAAASAAWVEVDRYQWRRYLNTEMTWSRSPVYHFYQSLPDLGRTPATCLLKISELGVPDREGDHYQHRWSLSRGGELFEEMSGPTGGAGGQHNLPAAGAQVQQRIAKLPPPDGALVAGRTPPGGLPRQGLVGDQGL